VTCVRLLMDSLYNRGSVPSGSQTNSYRPTIPRTRSLSVPGNRRRDLRDEPLFVPVAVFVVATAGRPGLGLSHGLVPLASLQQNRRSLKFRSSVAMICA